MASEHRADCKIVTVEINRIYWLQASHCMRDIIASLDSPGCTVADVADDIRSFLRTLEGVQHRSEGRCTCAVAATERALVHQARDMFEVLRARMDTLQCRYDAKHGASDAAVPMQCRYDANHGASEPGYTAHESALMEFDRLYGVRLWSAVVSNPTFGNIAERLAAVAKFEDDNAFPFVLECLTHNTRNTSVASCRASSVRLPDVTYEDIRDMKTRGGHSDKPGREREAERICVELARVADELRAAAVSIAPAIVPAPADDPQMRRWRADAASMMQKFCHTFEATRLASDKDAKNWPEHVQHTYTHWQKFELAAREPGAAADAMRAFLPTQIDRVKLSMLYGMIDFIRVENVEEEDAECAADMMADTDYRALYGDAFLLAHSQYMASLYRLRVADLQAFAPRFGRRVAAAAPYFVPF